MRRAQTATEYLIILSVVIIISLVVLSVFVGIPALGGKSGDQTSDFRLSAAAVGISSYAVSDYDTDLFIRNNSKSLFH